MLSRLFDVVAFLNCFQIKSNIILSNNSLATFFKGDKSRITFASISRPLLIQSLHLDAEILTWKDLISFTTF